MRKQGLQESGSQGAGTMQRFRSGTFNKTCAAAPARAPARCLAQPCPGRSCHLTWPLGTGPATRLLPRPPMGVVTERTKARRRPAGPS